MITSALSTALTGSGQQAVQSLAPHKHGHHHASSLADIHAMGSSAADGPSSTGKIGSKVDIKV